MGIYADSEEWADIVPIAQDDGGLNPLAAISYTEDYSEAMSYLRAVMARNENSQRVLELTVHIIKMNPAHYTVWLYRANVLLFLQCDLLQELEWLNKISLKYLKNYQIWHHRQFIMTHIPTLPPTEIAFLARMFNQDAKNYHVWSYRHWLVRHFSLWDSELPYIESLLQEDVRNNSAWNHRWFVVFCRYTDPAVHSIKDLNNEPAAVATATALAGGDTEAIGTGNKKIKIDPAIIEREIEYAKQAIRIAPQNQSPWNYLRGVLRNQGQGLEVLKDFAESFADVSREDEVRSSHALDFLADVYAAEEEVQGRERAAAALELLARRFDPIRRNYWNYRRELLGAAASVKA